jgi:hypothetical protein
MRQEMQLLRAFRAFIALSLKVVFGSNRPVRNLVQERSLSDAELPDPPKEGLRPRFLQRGIETRD